MIVNDMSFFYSWEDAYQKELETFKDIGDIGEIW